MDYIRDNLYVGKLALFAVYVVLAVISSYFLRIQRKLRKAKRWTPYKGSAIITAGQIAKIVSVLALIVACVFFSLSYGMHKSEAVVISIVQMLCIAVCITAAMTSLISLLAKKKSRTDLIRSILNISGNVLAVWAMLYFEMYRFWGC